MKTNNRRVTRKPTGQEDWRGHRQFMRHAVLTTLLVLSAVIAVPMAAAPLTLTTLVRTNDPAPGIAGGRFAFAPPNFGSGFQFGPPVAARGGSFACFAYVAVFDANGNQIQGGGTGIWGGVQGGGMALQFQPRMPAPPLGSNFTQRGLFNLSEDGPIAFFAQTDARSGPPDGLWVGSAGGGPLQIAHRLVIPPTTLGLIRPLQTGPYVGYGFQNTNWLYDTTRQQLRAVCWVGMPASVFGPGVMLSSIVNLALTLDGAFVVQGNTSDGTNRILLVKGPSEITPVLAEGQPAPGLPGRTIGIMSASGNERGDVAMLTRLADGDANPFNDRSALFAGPYTNVTLLAQSPSGVIWGGGTFITRSNHILGANATGSGIYKLAASTNESTTFTPLPPYPHPPLTPAGATLIASSLNALGQYVQLYGYGSGAANPLNPGIDLWLFRPGDGWTNVARLGSNIVVSGETIRVNNIGFQGNIPFGVGSGAGHATGLSDDGELYFCVNGTHLVTTRVPPCPGLAELLAFRAAGPGGAEEFHYTGLLGPNWHATTGDCPPETNWKDANGVGQPFPPGDVLPGTAVAIIEAFPGETIRVYERAVNLGSLHANQGLLRLQEHLTLNQPSGLHDLRMESPRGALTVNNGETVVSNTFEWVTGTVDGTAQFGLGSLSTTNLLLTNGTTVRLHAALLAQKRTEFDNGTTLILSNGVLRTREEFRAGTGTITKGGGSPPVQNLGVLRKQGAGDFTIDTPYHGFEALLRIPPWGIEVEEGRLRLCDGGQFLGYHTNEIDLGAEMELAGAFRFRPEYTAFRGNGTLKLGKPERSVELRVSSQVEFSLFEGGAHFTDGVITGIGSVTNGGAFYWEGGVVGRPDGIFRPGFQNGGELFIEDAPTPLRLEGPLVNSRQVTQRGHLEVHGRIENRSASRATRPADTPGIPDSGDHPPGEWKLTRPVDLRSGHPDALFVNRGVFNVEPQFSGEANIDVPFVSRDPSDPLLPMAAVICGRQDGPNPAFVLRFRGELGNYSPNGIFGRELFDGSWVVGPGCTVDFAGRDVEVIRELTTVVLNGGDMPSLKLAQNDGSLTFKNKHYSTPGALQTHGRLTVFGSSFLTVNGWFLSFGKLECDQPAVIEVAGDAELRGQIDGTGEIRASGVMTVNGAVQAGGVLQAPVVQFLDDSCISPGASPGTLRVVGLMIQAAGSVLEIEVAGTQTNQFDILSVTGPATLGGRLALSVIDGFRAAPGDTFPIIQATSLAGQFANATNGQRLATFDGYGSFLVTYSPTNVVLSAFQANPNPPPTAPGQLLAPSFRFGSMELTLTGSPGRDYILQTSTNLLHWLPLLTNNAGFDGQLVLELPAAPDPTRFFRALGR
jgi:hypothetical protein